MSSSAAILASSGPAASVPTALTTTTTSTTSTTTTNPTTTITNQQQQQAQYRGIVKQVNSGDCVIIRSVNTKDGKNLEKQIMLSNITAPRLGRRSGGSTDNAVIEPDQPFAFEAREFLRKKLIGKEVLFIREAVVSSTMDRGVLYLGKDAQSGENITDSLVAAGLVDVRQLNKPNEDSIRLTGLEEQAKSLGIGKWAAKDNNSGVRNLKYSIENPTNFVDSFRKKPIDAIIEYVRDGSTFRVLLLPSYQNVTIQLSGLKCPGFKRAESSDQPEVSEPFAEEAKFFVETRLLQRDVTVVLEGVANQANGILLGTCLHPNGNISEFLLREGLAKCVDWSMGVVSGPEKYRQAEKQAKQAKLRIWKNYVATSAGGAGLDENNKQLTGKCVEVLNGDGLVMKLNDGSFRKIFLSSIRPPRAVDFKDILPAVPKQTKGNPIYDVPYLFEAREFLRKKLIGKKVTCSIDYIQPKSEDYPEKVCGTVMLGDTNIAEAIVSQGLARVIHYKQDDDQRSSKYDDLLAAESRAKKKACGLHSTKEVTTMKVADVSSDSNKAKQFLPFLQRSGRVDALVEFVSSGSRFRLYIAKESCLITLLLGSIDCPRLGRPAMGGAAATPSDEYADEAFLFSKSHCLQHEVKIEIESMDKGGNFIGQLFTDDGVNLSLGLVESGFASVYKSAQSSPYFTLLQNAELRAKEKRLNRWKSYVEEKPQIIEHNSEQNDKNEPQERVIAQKKIVVTEVTNELHFYGQLVENGPKLEQLTVQLRSELAARPPVPGAYTPKVGDLCVAKFSLDDEWYRAKVLTYASATNLATVLFVDYGNREQTSATKLAQIPAGFEQLPAQAHEYALAFVQLSTNDEDDIEMAVDHFKSLVLSDQIENEFNINTEYKLNNVDFVTLTTSSDKLVDLGKQMVLEGYVSVDKTRRERRLQKLFAEYLKSLSVAKSAHKNMWRYGDVEADDAAEFGMKK